MSSAITWDMLESWAGIGQATLGGEKINNLSNLILMSTEVHEDFGSFTFWFEETVGSTVSMDERVQPDVLFRSRTNLTRTTYACRRGKYAPIGQTLRHSTMSPIRASHCQILSISQYTRRLRKYFTPLVQGNILNRFGEMRRTSVY